MYAYTNVCIYIIQVGWTHYCYESILGQKRGKKVVGLPSNDHLARH